MTDAIMSIHPPFSQAILDHIKHIECRTRPPKKPVGRVWIYETAPTKAIVGYFIPGTIYLPMQWRPLKASFGYANLTGEYRNDETQEDAILAKMFGDKLWSAIQIIEAHRIEPINPSDIWPDWVSPQSWKYLDEGKAKELWEVSECQIA
jgi:hypothetical protein